MLGPLSRLLTSDGPYQLTIAATFTSSGPAHCRSKPADAGAIPFISARCPPDDSPDVTMRLVSKLYCFAFLTTHRSAHRLSSTAAGDNATPAKRYSTLTTLHRICR